jgi:hypothetical protein
VIRELSRPRLVWDALILLLIVISSVLVTYQFAFDQAGALEGFQFLYLIDLFFLLDIVFNCVTTYRAICLRGCLSVTDTCLVARWSWL